MSAMSEQLTLMTELPMTALVAWLPDTSYGSGTLLKSRYSLKSPEHHRPLFLNI